MTQAQQEALEAIRKLMREHFDTAFFVYEVEDENTATGWHMSYTGTGGHAASIGLVRYAENAMLNPPEDDSGEEGFPLLRWSHEVRLTFVSTIPTKSACYRLYENGAFGNKLRTWNDLASLMRDDYCGGVVMRYKGAGGGTEYPRYGQEIPKAEVADTVQSWVSAGASRESIRFNEAAWDDKLVIQGEVMRSQEHLSLFYSREKTKMREALKRGQQVQGLRAAMLLRHTLSPASYDDMETLIEQYPDAVIEFSAYSHNVGNCRGRNAVIWEVRNY